VVGDTDLQVADAVTKISLTIGFLVAGAVLNAWHFVDMRWRPGRKFRKLAPLFLFFSFITIAFLVYILRLKEIQYFVSPARMVKAITAGLLFGIAGVWAGERIRKFRMKTR
jgi:hypothetical protein